MTEAPAAQLTPRALVLGAVLAVVLGGANAYLGLFAGMTVSACIPSAVISMGVLRLFGRPSILENNIVQTQASAGETLAAGCIFTLPALILLGVWKDFDYLWVCGIAGVGGMLGVLLTIPLRRALIVERGLPFPEGTATAEVLRVGEGHGQGLRALGLAGLTGALVKLGEAALRLWPGTAQAAGWVGQRGIAYVGTNLSPALLGVGYIVGLNVAVLVFLGGVLSWNIAIPIYSSFFLAGDPQFAHLPADIGPADLAFQIWTHRIRYLGVGAMLVGGFWALISMRKSLLAGVRSGLEQFRRAGNETTAETERDLPMPWVLAGIAACLVPIYFLYLQIVGSAAIAAVMAVTMLVAGFLFSSVAAYMAGLVGSSNNPISGVTMATMLLTSLLLLGLMGPDVRGPAAAIMVGAVVCCAASLGGDLLQDLKTGQLVGATPWKQQVALAAGVAVSVLVMAPVLNLLLHAYGIGVATPEHPRPLPAPQATLMASVAQGVFQGGLPWPMVIAGAVIGAAIIATDEVLRSRGSSFRAPVLAVAIGIYLPLEVSTPMFLGGLVAQVVRPPAGTRAGADGGTLFAAGLITGEALVGILLAVPIVLTGDTELLAVPEAWRPGPLAGLAAFGFAAWLLTRAVRGRI